MINETAKRYLQLLKYLFTRGLMIAFSVSRA